MYHYKTVVIPEHEESQLDKTTCDICGDVIKHETTEVNVSYWKDENFVYFYDICIECFTNKIVPFINNSKLTGGDEK